MEEQSSFVALSFASQGGNIHNIPDSCDMIDELVSGSPHRASKQTSGPNKGQLFLHVAEDTWKQPDRDELEEVLRQEDLNIAKLMANKGLGLKFRWNHWHIIGCFQRGCLPVKAQTGKRLPSHCNGQVLAMSQVLASSPW